MSDISESEASTVPVVSIVGWAGAPIQVGGLPSLSAQQGCGGTGEQGCGRDSPVSWRPQTAALALHSAEAGMLQTHAQEPWLGGGGVAGAGRSKCTVTGCLPGAPGEDRIPRFWSQPSGSPVYLGTSQLLSETEGIPGFHFTPGALVSSKAGGGEGLGGSQLRPPVLTALPWWTWWWDLAEL